MEKVKLFVMMLLSTVVFFSCGPDPVPEPEPDPDPEMPVLKDYRDRFCGQYEYKYTENDNNGQPIEYVLNYLITKNVDMPGVVNIVKTTVDDDVYFEDNLIIDPGGHILRSYLPCVPAAQVYSDYHDDGTPLPELPYSCFKLTNGDYQTKYSKFTLHYNYSEITSDTILKQPKYKMYVGYKRAGVPAQPEPPVPAPDYRDAWKGKYRCSITDDNNVFSNVDLSQYEYEICAYPFLENQMMLTANKTKGGNPISGIEVPNCRIIINSEGESTQSYISWSSDAMHGEFKPKVIFRNDSIYCSYLDFSVANGTVYTVTYSGPRIEK